MCESVCRALALAMRVRGCVLAGKKQVDSLLRSVRAWARARMVQVANGMSDNLVTSVLRAWDPAKPIILAPAMNTIMYTLVNTFFASCSAPPAYTCHLHTPACVMPCTKPPCYTEVEATQDSVAPLFLSQSMCIQSCMLFLSLPHFFPLPTHARIPRSPTPSALGSARAHACIHAKKHFQMLEHTGGSIP